MRMPPVLGKRRLHVALATSGAAVATLLGASPADADTGLAVTNPSFIQPWIDPISSGAYLTVGYASDAIAGWRVTNGNVDVYGRATAKTSGSSVVENGSQSIDLNGGEPGGIEQTLNTTPGTTVTVSFAARINDHPWCEANAATVNESMFVQFAGDPDSARFFSLGSVSAPGKYTEWQLLRAVLPATGRHSRLQFISSTTGGCGPQITDIKATDNLIP